jgi:hypothetical protein
MHGNVRHEAKLTSSLSSKLSRAVDAAALRCFPLSPQVMIHAGPQHSRLLMWTSVSDGVPEGTKTSSTLTRATPAHSLTRQTRR